MKSSSHSINEFKVLTIGDKPSDWQIDTIACEEPLQITIQWQENQQLKSQVFSITMRSPGNDKELLTGLLYSEGIITSSQQIKRIYPEQENDKILNNQLMVELVPNSGFNAAEFTRFLSVNSACGLCGKTQLQTLSLKNPPEMTSQQPVVNASTLMQLPTQLTSHQQLFHATGGVHASSLFNAQGELLALREDVGRHNALDKLVGYALNQRKIPLKNSILLLSGRASYELLQKAIMAGIPMVVAIGAPSSMAIQAATQFGVTLIGFLKDTQFNIYHGHWRINNDLPKK